MEHKSEGDGGPSSKFYTFSAVDMAGQTRSMSEFKGMALCVVNVARKCEKLKDQVA